MVIRIISIADTELGLVYRNGRFRAILAPGTRRSLPRLMGYEVRKLDLCPLPLKDAALEALYLTHPERVAEYMVVADMGDSELGLVFVDGKLADLVGPGERAFYARLYRDVRVQIIDLAVEVDLPAELLAPITRMRQRNLVKTAEVPADFTGLLYVDGVLRRQLAPGRYGFLQGVRRIDVITPDRRLQTLEVTGQEILTKDRIGLRANVTALFRIADPEVVVSVTADPRDYLYKQVQFALRQVVGTRTLEEILGDKEGITVAMTGAVVPLMADAGIEVRSIGVKDVILPGDVRELMNRVIEAEKTAQANVIKRREETAATRSLLNTAKLMEDNPILLRLKELEALEKVSEKVGNVIVGNGMDGVLDDLVRIRPRVRPADRT